MSDASSPPASLSLRLFGPFVAHLDGRPLPRLRSQKGQWLLALLVLRHGSEIGRSWLAGLLWPESPEPQALANLRNSLTDLRHALGREAHRLLSPTPQSLMLDVTGADVDVIAFDRAVADGGEAAIAEAVELYRGPLLEGCAEEWAFQEREARQVAYLEARERLAAAAASRREWDAAERHLRRVIAVDVTRETSQRELMRVLSASGNYAAAIHAYRELRLYLHRELNAEPDPETRTLFEQILERKHEGAAPPQRRG